VAGTDSIIAFSHPNFDRTPFEPVALRPSTSVREHLTKCLAQDGACERAFDVLADPFLGQQEMSACGQLDGQNQQELEVGSVVERNLRAVRRGRDSRRTARK
jgi:hypothetical protein